MKKYTAVCLDGPALGQYASSESDVLYWIEFNKPPTVLTEASLFPDSVSFKETCYKLKMLKDFNFGLFKCWICNEVEAEKNIFAFISWLQWWHDLNEPPFQIAWTYRWSAGFERNRDEYSVYMLRQGINEHGEVVNQFLDKIGCWRNHNPENHTESAFSLSGPLIHTLGLKGAFFENREEIASQLQKLVDGIIQSALQEGQRLIDEAG